MGFDVNVDVDAIEALPDFATLSYGELVELIVGLIELERKLSAERALVQGRLDILRAERVRRLTPPPRKRPVIDQLVAILARRPRKRWWPGNAHA
jgi:hypothetical protein